MKNENQISVRLRRLGSSVLLSLATSGIVWLACVVGYCCLYKASFVAGNEDIIFPLFSLVAFIAFIWCLLKYWNAVLSVNLYKAELLIGFLIVLIGGFLFVEGAEQSGGAMFAGFFEVLLGCSLGLLGLLTIIAGYLDRRVVTRL